MSNQIVTISPDFLIYDSIGKSATTSSAAYALPIDSTNTNQWQTLFITNTATSGFTSFELGGSGATATADSTALLAGQSMVVNRNNKTYIALLASTGTQFISITVGSYGSR